MAPPSPTEDYYSVLEVDHGADMVTIKASYKRLAKLLHPDKNFGDPSATANFQRLEAAYSTLSNPNKRPAYDRQRTQGPKKATNMWETDSPGMASQQEWRKQYAERVRKGKEEMAAEEKRKEAAAQARQKWKQEEQARQDAAAEEARRKRQEELEREQAATLRRRRVHQEELDRQEEEWRIQGEKWRKRVEGWKKLAEERKLEEEWRLREEDEDGII